MDKAKRKKIFWIMYFALGFILMILRSHGVFRSCSERPNPEPNIPSYENLVVENYTLYEYITGNEIGEIIIKEIDYERMVIVVNASAVKGEDPIFNREYNFPELAIESFVLNKKLHNEEEYYSGSENGVNIIIINIFKGRYSSSPIPEILYSDTNRYFLFTIVNDRRYDYVNMNISPVPLNRDLINGAYESIYSGIFYVEK